MKSTELTRSEILAKYNRMSYKRKFEIIYSALDYMEQYNGRSKKDCIVLAMCNAYALIEV